MELEDIFRAADAMVDHGELTEMEKEAVQPLDEMLAEWSGQDNADFWWRDPESCPAALMLTCSPETPPFWSFLAKAKLSKSDYSAAQALLSVVALVCFTL